MYTHFFGLKRDPFAMTPDPGVLHMTAAQREAYSGLLYGVMARKGFVVLIGDPGTGKTTLLNKLMAALNDTSAQFSVLLNPTLSSAEFLEAVLGDFGVADIPQSKPQRLLVLKDLLIQAHERRAASVLIVDEAHTLNRELLEEIRLLSNLEHPDGKLLQIVLVGQLELADTLDRQDLQQLKQRVAVRLKLGRFSPAELQAYIAYRWTAAGGGVHPFSAGAVELITRYSKAIPRVVNALCDNALMLAFADSVPVVSTEHVEEAAQDLAFVDPACVAPALNPAAAADPGMSKGPDSTYSVAEACSVAGASPLSTAPVSIEAAPGKPERPEKLERKDVPPLAPFMPMLERYGRKPEKNGSFFSRLLAATGWVA